MTTDYSARIAALEAAAASGKLTIESDGDRVTYRSMNDLLRAIDFFQARQAASVAPGMARPASTVVVFDPR